MTLCHSMRGNDPFTRLKKSIVFDNSISLKAKGILSIAFSRPDDWTFYKSEMMSHCTDGEHSFDSGIKELEEAGYLHRATKQDQATGKFSGGLDWFFFEEPITSEQFKKIHRNGGFPATGEIPPPGKPGPTKKDLSTKKDNITKKEENPLPPKGEAASAAKESSSSLLSSFSQEVLETGQAVIDAVIAEKPDFLPPKNTYQLLRTIDLLIRVDKRSPQRIMAILQWALSDDFWRPHFMKPNPAAYLRSKFDQLETKMNKPYTGENKVDRRTKNQDGTPITVPQENLF